MNHVRGIKPATEFGCATGVSQPSSWEVSEGTYKSKIDLTLVKRKFNMAADSKAFKPQAHPLANLPAVRITPDERAKAKPTHNPGSSNVEGAEEVTILGDPTKPGMYVQLLNCPPGQRVQAHHHAGDRVATVLSGSWNFG